jgi:hypothetical protein
MNIHKKSFLLVMAVIATPLVLGGADSAPKSGSKAPEEGQQRDRAEPSMVISGNSKVSVFSHEQRDRVQPSMVISSNSEASVLIGSSDRLIKLEVGASKMDAQKVAIRLVFASGTKLTVDLERYQAELITAEMSKDGAEDGPVQIHCRSLEFDFGRPDPSCAKAHGSAQTIPRSNLIMPTPTAC